MRFSRLLLSLTALLALAACQEQEVAPGATATRWSSTSFRSGVCDAFPTIDRSPLGMPLPQANASTPSNQTMAGIQSTFAPGAQPVPCDRLHIHQVQGLTTFQGSLGTNLEPATTNAFLEISSFEPDGTIAMTDTELWVTANLGEGVLQSYTGQTFDHCRFRVATVMSNFANRTHAQGWLPTTALASGTGQFVVPFTQPRLINVTPEFRRALSGRGFALAFAIEPNDSNITAKANNRCAGRMNVRLRLIGPD